MNQQPVTALVAVLAIAGAESIAEGKASARDPFAIEEPLSAPPAPDRTPAGGDEWETRAYYGIGKDGKLELFETRVRKRTPSGLQAQRVKTSGGKPWPKQNRSGERKRGNSDASGFVILLVIGSICAVLSQVFGNRCPHCARPRALEKTGRSEKDGDGWFASTESEWKCRHCGGTVWREQGGGGGGGGGCGGGCGGG